MIATRTNATRSLGGVLATLPLLVTLACATGGDPAAWSGSQVSSKGSQDSAPRGSRALFLVNADAAAPIDGEGHPPATKNSHQIGFRTHLELLGSDGTIRNVADDHAFVAGDRIRIHVTSNVSGHLWITQAGSDKVVKPLIPAGGTEGVPITAHKEVVIPDGGNWFQFNADEAVEEKLVFYLYSGNAGDHGTVRDYFASLTTKNPGERKSATSRGLVLDKEMAGASSAKAGISRGISIAPNRVETDILTDPAGKTIGMATYSITPEPAEKVMHQLTLRRAR